MLYKIYYYKDYLKYMCIMMVITIVTPLQIGNMCVLLR